MVVNKEDITKSLVAKAKAKHVEARTKKEKFMVFMSDAIKELLELRLSYRAISKLLNDELNANEELRTQFDFKKTKADGNSVYIKEDDVRNFVKKFLKDNKEISVKEKEKKIQTTTKSVVKQTDNDTYSNSNLDVDIDLGIKKKGL